MPLSVVECLCRGRMPLSGLIVGIGETLLGLERISSERTKKLMNENSSGT